MNPLDYLVNAEYVFIATITQIVKENPANRDAIAKFDISEVLKGDPSSLESISTEGFYAIPFYVGVEYLFFASKDGEVGFCTGTTTLENAKEVLQEIVKKYKTEGYLE